jgi:hypothetical protein
MKKNKIIFLLKWKSRHLLPFLCVCLLLCSTIVFIQTTIAQRETVDTQGEIRREVNAKLKETSIGTITDATGEFNLKISERNATLEFSYIGLKKYEL